MTEQDIAVFQGRYFVFELLVVANGNLVIEAYTNEGDLDEEAQLELTQVDAQTLGQLLLRYAKNGSTKP